MPSVGEWRGAASAAAPPSWGGGVWGCRPLQGGWPAASPGRGSPVAARRQRSPTVPTLSCAEPAQCGRAWAGLRASRPSSAPCPLPGDPWGQPVGPGPGVPLAPLSMAPDGDFGPHSGASTGPARWFSWGLCFGFSSSLDSDPTVCIGAGASSSKDRQCLAGGGARGRLPGRVRCSDAGLASVHPQGQTPPTPEPPSSGG